MGDWRGREAESQAPSGSGERKKTKRFRVAGLLGLLNGFIYFSAFIFIKQ